MRGRIVASVVATGLLLASCSDSDGASEETPPVATVASSSTTTAAPTTTVTAAPSTTASTSPSTTTIATTAPPTTVSPFARPEWLGTRVLPLRPDDFGEVQPTPPELVDRQLETPPGLDPPPDDAYVATISAVPPEVVARSTWRDGCPVALDDLAYLTVSHWGFDGGHHLGEIIVNVEVADDVVEVFGRLHEARFPIEEVRVIDAPELDAPPTGDGNVTTGFVCRPAVGSGSWSQHAFGLAVDINPFHNPYLKGDLVLPELASAYLDRERDVPGMVTDGDVVVEAFASIGWGWGGNWNSLKDWMHFSRNGR